MTLNLTNTLLFDELANYIKHATSDSRIGAFYGYSGYGKTISATRGANNINAIYLCIGASWTKRIFTEKLAEAIKAPIGKTIGHTVQNIIKRLNGTNTPIIIDEFDIGIEKRIVENLREIHDETGIPIIIIGEEKLAHKLEEFERFHNRVIKWQAAQAASFDDAKIFIANLQPNINYADALIEHIRKYSKGILRRIETNTNILAEHANLHNITNLTLDNIQGVQLFTGAVAMRRLGE